jgi:two-component system, NarL family, sensor histidine kinase NreB
MHQKKFKGRGFIVEDEFIISQNLNYKLEENGYSVVEIVSTGEKALELLSDIHDQVDFILMDIMLDGELDGIQTAEIVKNLYNIPVIFLTAYSSDTFLERSKIAEPYAYILKPFSDRELLINIEIAIYKHSIEKQLKETQYKLKELNEKLEEKVAEQTREIIEQNKALQKLSMVVEQSHESVIITDKNGNIEYVNPTFCSNYGYKAAEVIGKNSRFLKSGVHHPRYYEALWNTIIQGKVFDTEMVNKTKQNELIFEEKTITALKNSHNEITHFVSTGKNVTDRKLVEEKNAENEKLLTSIYAGLPALLFIFDVEQGKITFINEYVTKLTGYSIEEVKNMEYQELLQSVPTLVNEGFTLEGLADFFLKDMNATYLKEVKIKYKNNKAGWLNISASVFDVNGNGDLSQLICTAMDISKQRRGEKQLKAMLRLHEIMKKKEQKLRTLSLLQGQEKERRRLSMEIHDNIGQLLTATKLNIDKLDNHSCCEVKCSGDEQCKNSISAIKDLIKQSITEVRKVSNDIAPSSLRDFGLYSALKSMLEKIGNAGINVSLESDSSTSRFAPFIEQEVFRIAQEAVSNAIKYSLCMHLNVKFSFVNEELYLSVEDDGKGFEVKSNLPGLGILSMTERAKALGGKINVISQPDNGCKVEFKLTTSAVEI